MIVAERFLEALRPPPTLTVSEWSDRFRRLSSEASPEPGQWSTARAPFQRAIMDAWTDPLVETVVVMSSAQVGKTEMLLNAIGYVVDIDPGPILLVQPTLEMAEAFSKDRLDPMVRDTPSLQAKVSANRRDASNTLRHKAFPGGQITLAGSNSPASLASRPIRYVLVDEADRFESTKEGDPIALATKRTTRFWNRKHLIVSTPSVKGISRIESRFEESDQRRCYVACPHCDHQHVLQWRHVKWADGRPDSAALVCPGCGAEIDEQGRAAMLRAPVWRATAPFTGTAGFHIWEAYSPWRRLADIVADFLEAKRATDTLQVFVNTSLGETWEEQGEQADGSVLLARREPYTARVPDGACCLTAGVDVQDDRLEALVIGWGPGEESWVVDHRVIPGDPQRPEPWQELDQLLAEPFAHETGAMVTVMASCIDTAGHRTQYAYDFCRTRRHQRVHAVIGRAGSDMPIVSSRSTKGRGTERRTVDLYTVGTDQTKALLYSRLKITERGPGFVHLPLAHQGDDAFRDGVDEEFIAQLTSEKLVTKHRMGVPHRVWVETRARNEALDMFVYAIAALRLLRPNLEAMLAQLRPTREPVAKPSPAPTRSAWVPKQHGWLKGRR